MNSNDDLADSGGAGMDLSNLVYEVGSRLRDQRLYRSQSQAFRLAGDEHRPAQVHIGNKVWSRLVAAGYTNAVSASWLAAGTNDYQVANIGQPQEHTSTLTFP